MSADWSVAAYLALGAAGGVSVSMMATLPLLRKAWGAYQREQDYLLAQRVSEILGDIKHTQAQADAPDAARNRDAAEAILFKLKDARAIAAKAQAAVENLSEYAAHVAAGGDTDDPPSRWIKVPKK